MQHDWCFCYYYWPLHVFQKHIVQPYVEYLEYDFLYHLTLVNRYKMSAPSPCHGFTSLYRTFQWNFLFMDHFLCIWSVASPNPVHFIRGSGGHGGKLDLCVFSWLTGKNLSLSVPVEKERIVECRPWQSIPCVPMVGLSWTASSTADIYTQLTQLSEREKTDKGEQVYERWDILSTRRKSVTLSSSNSTRKVFYWKVCSWDYVMFLLLSHDYKQRTP